MPIEDEADRDDSHHEQRGAAPGNCPNPRRHAPTDVSERP
jgi:hypothetical protein